MAGHLRLDKYLADAGTGTRSEVKRYIQKQRVQVNGEMERDPSRKIDPDLDQICLDGQRVKVSQLEYYLLHKPAGCVSATRDNSGQKTVMDYVPAARKDLFPVGRLDKDTEGLLLVTNDGQLAHALLSPKRHVPKTYYALVRGRMDSEDAEIFRGGVDFGEKKPALPAKLRILDVKETEEGWITQAEITIREGKYHQVKRMVQAVGKEVIYLRRISMGSLRLEEELKKGQCRPLREDEIKGLLEDVR